MAGPKKRMILYHESPATLTDVKYSTDRGADLITAADGATIEAALRLYQHVDVVVAEKTSADNTAIKMLMFAREKHPNARRVLLVDCDAIANAYSAVHDGTIGTLLFKPARIDQLREAFGLPAMSEHSVTNNDPMLHRLRAHPPLTGGNKASSSPLVSR